MHARISRRTALTRMAGAAAAVTLANAWPAQAAAAGEWRRPLLLVHGFNQEAGIWYRADNAIVAQLSESGYRWSADSMTAFAYPDLPGQPGVEDSEGDIAATGAALASTIVDLAGKSLDGQVDVLAFSMGGLATRWAVSSLRDRHKARPLVNRAILVATPNNGADILHWLSTLTGTTLNALTRELFDLDPASPGARQMLPGSAFLSELNQQQRSDERVRYSLVAANARLQSRLGILSTSIDIGDGMVSAASAGYLPGNQARLYTLSEQLDGSGTAPWLAVQHSPIYHEALLANDTVALVVANELGSSTMAIQHELESRLGHSVTASWI